MYLCEQCGKEVYEKYGSGRFCSRSCSNKYVALHQSDEAKARKVEAGKKNLELRKVRVSKKDNKVIDRKFICVCGKEFSNGRSLGGHKCSCKIYNNWSDKKYKEHIKKNHYTGGRDIEDILNNMVVYQSNRLKWRLIDKGYKDRKCEKCGLSEWLGNPIPIELHHKDGNKMNNSLDNLEILCPNCHTFTDNYRWKAARNK